MEEHRRAFQKADFEVSALAEHAWKLDHRVDWENIAILNQDHKLCKQLALECKRM